MGNRGGRFHTPDNREIGRRTQASRRWICCQLSYKQRQRTVWGAGYTEVFFVDEVTALAAGHRPCFECRRDDAMQFQAAWAEGAGTARPSAGAMDAVLSSERREGRVKRVHGLPIDTVPNGAMIVLLGHAFAVSDEQLLPWSFAGYGKPLPRPKLGDATVLTPPSIMAALRAGYRPRWHPSALGS